MLIEKVAFEWRKGKEPCVLRDQHEEREGRFRL